MFRQVIDSYNNCGYHTGLIGRVCPYREFLQLKAFLSKLLLAVELEKMGKSDLSMFPVKLCQLTLCIVTSY